MMSSRIIFEVEDFKDILQTLEKPVSKHQQHDQSSHGNWASSTEIESLDYIPDSESQPDLYSDDFFREENDQNIANL